MDWILMFWGVVQLSFGPGFNYLEGQPLIYLNLTFVSNPMEIYVDDEAKLTLHGLVQHYLKLTELEKNRKLNDLLDALDFNQVVIFVKSVNRAAKPNKLLVEYNFPSICIHSGMSQEERLIVGRFGTKGLAITFVSSASNLDVLTQVQERFEVDMKELPEQIDTSTYSDWGFHWGGSDRLTFTLFSL